MTAREAHDLVRAIEHLWNYDMGSEGRTTWAEALSRYDSNVASEAVIKLSERQPQRPTIADIRNMVRNITAARTPAPKPALPRGKDELPTWAQVWAWARWTKADLRAFPQQADHVLADMTPAEYQALEAEWLEAGSPKMTVDSLVRVMSGI